MRKKEMKKHIDDLTIRNRYLEIQSRALQLMLEEKDMYSQEEFEEKFVNILSSLDKRIS